MGSRRKDPTTTGKIDIDLVLVLVQHDGSRSGKEDGRAAEGEEGCRNASGMCYYLTAKKRWENSCIFSAFVAEGEVQRLGTKEGVDDNGLAEVKKVVAEEQQGNQRWALEILSTTTLPIAERGLEHNLQDLEIRSQSSRGVERAASTVQALRPTTPEDVLWAEEEEQIWWKMAPMKAAGRISNNYTDGPIRQKGEERQQGGDCCGSRGGEGGERNVAPTSSRIRVQILPAIKDNGEEVAITVGMVQ
ncbi:hypothetical protein B296_00003955 [Ensete ventricosum]|uniref:Uncharacterized protein n=1 Tax=Ensete ventricosum TaxID=4639 RepID=A0A427BA58_ENSVE|nr:hypothetical protein B296_00003955 [Ensete ventricosum]